MTLPACDRIIELAEKASPAPWKYKRRGCEAELHNPYGMMMPQLGNCEAAHDDAKFIAAARTVAPKIAMALNEAVRAIEEDARHSPLCNTTGVGHCDCWKSRIIVRINELLTNP